VESPGVFKSRKNTESIERVTPEGPEPTGGNNEAKSVNWLRPTAWDPGPFVPAVTEMPLLKFATVVTRDVLKKGGEPSHCMLTGPKLWDSETGLEPLKESSYPQPEMWPEIFTLAKAESA
jgi:hypothetical protein